MFFSIRSASLFMSRPRSAPLIFGQGPSSNALRAAFTARSTSALSPSATWQMVSPVAGLTVGKVLPDSLSSHLPPIKSGWSLTLGGLTARALVWVAVAMVRSPVGGREGRPASSPARAEYRRGGGDRQRPRVARRSASVFSRKTDGERRATIPRLRPAGGCHERHTRPRLAAGHGPAGAAGGHPGGVLP